MVYHILKDGSRPKDITGHIVKMDEVPLAYEILKSIERRRTNEKKDDSKSLRVCM